jgi:hypothetical protein
MIENIRKYTGLMIVVFVLLFISFFFLDSSSVRSLGSGGGVIRIDGRVYSEKEYRRLGASSLDLTQSLARSGDFGLYSFLMSMTGEASGPDDAVEKFFVSRMILRRAADEFGIHPASDEINTHIRSMRAFAGPDGEFNEENYRTFIDRGMGRLGMTENDLRELATDVLISQKLNAIIGSGLGANRDFIAKNLAFENQQITGGLARLDLFDYEDIEPTEEQIKEYWENIQDAFMTEPRRKFTYVLATPEAVGETPEDDKPETFEEAAMTDEQKAKANQKKEEERAKRAAELADKRREKQLALDRLVDDFLFELEQKKGEGFEDLAKENGWEVKTTELFILTDAPEDLALELRSSSRGGKAVEELFRMVETSDPFSKISEAIAVGENQWIVARLDGEEKSRPKTYAEARNDARAQYIEEKAIEALKAAADEAAAKIREELEAGKSFAEAAAAAGIEETQAFTEITSTYRPDGTKEPQNLFEVTRNVDPGSLADPVIESDRAFIVHVAKREVLKSENPEARIDGELVSQTTNNQTIAFLAWMKARTGGAKGEPIARRPWGYPDARLRPSRSLRRCQRPSRPW